ncbi:DUF4870 family protein [Celerinatantimonas sp. YJH-8]|uniref:DUF4870 family protein n=1 Tax=Celerinatantimonas sp. YJH-8 TaxID=3228714 RepID=UPI0038C7ED58
MNQYDRAYTVPYVMSEYEIDAKNHALVAYILMTIGLFTGVLWFVGAIWAMVKISDATGTLFEDHYRNMIHVFWWWIGWSVVGFALSIILVGYLVIFLTWLWSLYRIIKGLARITSNRSYKGACFQPVI